MFKKTLDFFFPVRCIICSKTIQPGRRTDNRSKCFCSSCAALIPAVWHHSGKKCPVCSRDMISELNLCMNCRKRDYSFSRNISLWNYRDPLIRKTIHEYKFRNRKTAAFFFAESLYRVISDYFTGYTIIPAPCSRKRLAVYGYDHMKYISKILARNYGVTVSTLFTKKTGREQKKLDYEHRLTELKGKIKVSEKKAVEALKYGDSALIIDDVFTTGSTANQCSEILLAIGFKKISILTIALD